MPKPRAPYGPPPKGFTTWAEWEEATLSRGPTLPDEPLTRADLENLAEMEGKLLRMPQRRPATVKLPK